MTRRAGRISRTVILVFSFVFTARECAANVAPPPAFFLLPAGLLGFFISLITHLIPIAPLAAFGIWLRGRYRTFPWNPNRAKAYGSDVIYLCAFTFLAGGGIFVVSSSYVFQGNRAALALIPLLMLLLSICLGSKRYMTDGFAALCADFGTISRQFYVTSFIYCAASLLFVYFFPRLPFALGEDYLSAGLFMSLAVGVPAAVVFVNCKILDGVQPGLRDSNAVLAVTLYVRLLRARCLRLRCCILFYTISKSARFH
jgi:hypothetical protein